MWMNSQGEGIGETGTSIRVGPSRRLNARLQRRPQLLRTARTLGFGAEALRIAHEIGIGEIAGDQAIAELLLLDAPHVAEGAVVEHDDGQRDAMADSGGKLVGSEEKPAVTRDREHRHIGARVLRAERGGIAPAQIVLIAGRKEGSRLVDRQQKPRGETRSA